MRVVCVLCKSVADFVMEEMSKLSNVDVIIFRYGIISDIDFSDDTNSYEDALYDLSLLSYNLHCIILAGCDTILFGVKRKSCLVFYNGKLLGINDSNFISSKSEYKSGFGYKVFDTEKANFGVVVCDDIKHSMPGHIIAHALGDYVFCVCDCNIEVDLKNYAKSTSMFSGLDGIYVFNDDALSCSSKGDIDFGSGDNVRIFDIKRTSEYFDIMKKIKK